MIVLVDMDGVLANFELGFLNSFRAAFPNIDNFIPLDQRTTFRVKKQYPIELQEKVDEIIFAKGFFKSLPPISGSIAAIRKIIELGHDIFICTSPLRNYKNCVLEKYEWIDKHLGQEFIRRIILTRDKTMISGDLLIDDKPEITGTILPSWEHVIYRQPYNAHVKDRRAISWNNWESLFE